MPNCPLRCQAFNRESIRRVDQTNYCTICFDNVFYCKLLPCGHIFCSVCIDNMLHNERQLEQQQRRDHEYQRNQLFRQQLELFQQRQEQPQEQGQQQQQQQRLCCLCNNDDLESE